jgi:hypothetical protein
VTDPVFTKQLEEMGPSAVRELLVQWTGSARTEAIAWLASHDEEERSRNEASQASQIRVALSARRAAWIAAIAAIIAAIAAIITIVVELVKA